MKKSIFLGIIAIIFMLFLPANAICDPAGPPGGMDVKIVGQDQPVEVTGDVNADVTGNVNATVSGEVDIANTPDVNVVNTPVVKAQQEGDWKVKIQKEKPNTPVIFCLWEMNCGMGCELESYQVPYDHRLVVEWVSGETTLDDLRSDDRPSLGLTIYPDSGNEGNYIPIGAMERGPQSVSGVNPTFTLGKAINIHASPGDNLHLSTDGSPNTVEVFHGCIAGYLEPITQ